MASSFRSAFEDEYASILAIARARLSNESAPISTVTLAHQVFINLSGRDSLRFETKGQFLAYAARAMRSLLVDMARERLTQKRQAELVPLTLAGEVADRAGGTPEQILALNQALERLGQIDARLLQMAEMRAVMGMEVTEIAETLGLSAPTIKRDWQRAKAYLFDALGA